MQCDEAYLRSQNSICHHLPTVNISLAFFQIKLWSGVLKTGSGPVGSPAGRMFSGTGCIIITVNIIMAYFASR